MFSNEIAYQKTRFMQLIILRTTFCILRLNKYFLQNPGLGILQKWPLSLDVKSSTLV